MASEETTALVVENYDESSDSDDVCEGNAPSLPFTMVHQKPIPFDDPNVKCLIPGYGVKIKISSFVCKPTDVFNPYLYSIDTEHGPFQWTVKKRYKDFFQLYNQLFLYRTMLSMYIPKKRSKVSRRSPKSGSMMTMPNFPLSPDYFVKRTEIKKRMKALERYLQNVLKMEPYRCYYEMLQFLGICPLSFVDELGGKRKEGYVLKRSGGYSQAVYTNPFKLCCAEYCKRWSWRWMMAKDNFIACINPYTGHVECVMLVDGAFDCTADERVTKYSGGLQICNYSRCLLVKCRSTREAEEWQHELKTIKYGTGADFVGPNSHGSFAPERPFTNCRWIIDGATYFEAVASVLDKAKQEIFITGWWLVPEFYLKRPTVHGHYWQLDHVLKRKAVQGVKIFILLYKEVELALGIHSAYSEQRLQSLHRNIKVLRHPTSGVFLWAHHEKIICIDQTYAFVGGLDLCYGRWDDYQHRLTDLGEVEEKLKVLRHISTLPGLNETLSVRRSHPMPFLPPCDQGEGISYMHPTVSNSHRSSLQESISNDVSSKQERTRSFSGQEIADTTAKFRVAGTKVLAASTMKTSGTEETMTDEDAKQMLINLPAPADMHRTVQEMALVYLGIERKFRLWHGKDYANFITKDIMKLDKPYTDIIDRHETPRMPWHDVALFIQGAAARDVGRHFIQRWNFTKSKKVKRDFSYPYLLPKCYDNAENEHPLLTTEAGTMFFANCQVLRSISQWSAGVEMTECSIHEAYIAAIGNAKHFIYIENQFFITQPTSKDGILNGISNALYDKITEADRKKKPFRVYVMMPLLPAFEGEIGTGSGTVIQAVTHWNYKSICRSSTSLYQRLAQRISDPSKYIYFYGLRTHCILNNKLVTELIYVHSKLMIVDDKMAIIGSANLNDRSLIGRRDSEIAVLVQDTVFVDSVMDGKPYKAGTFCYSLRKALFREHLGLFSSADYSVDVSDAVSENFFKNVWYKTAVRNTMLYEKAFHCIPSDKVRRFADLKSYNLQTSLAVTNPKAALALLQQVQGHLVVMPFNFLCDEDLIPKVYCKERYLPESVWT